MDNRSSLFVVTHKLLQYTDTILSQFEKVKDSRIKGDFLLEVKPFADEVREVNDKWKELASQFIGEWEPRNIHMNQIYSAYDQMEMVSVQCFYPETSRTRFLNNIRSIQYIYKIMLEHIEA